MPPAQAPTRVRPPEPRRRSRNRHLIRDLLTVSAYALMATPITIFLADGGVTKFGTLGGVLTGVGIIAGLIATTALVIMVLLTARIPLVEQAIGQDRATSLHARLGRTTFLGLVAHAVLLLVGYAVTARIDVIAQFREFWGVEDFVPALLGLGLLTVVAVSSMAAARRTLAYEIWHVLHLLSYAAVLLSIPHQFTIGGLFSDGPAYWFWAGLFLITGFCLLNYRILRPLILSWQHRLVVRRVVPMGPDTVSIEFSGRRLGELGAQGGQYFHWRFLARGLWWAQHPFSLAAAPTPHTLRITVRNLGRGTERLLRVRPGTRVMIEGPYGIFTNTARTRDHLVAVGIGIGITPIRALLEEADFAPGHGTVILRARDAAGIYLGAEIQRLCAAKGAQLIVLLGPRGASWLPSEYTGYTLADLATHLAKADLFVCGPRGAAEQVIAEARAAGVRQDQIHNERFDW